MFRGADLSLDFLSDPGPEKMFRNPLVARLFSVQSSLGFKGDRARRSLSAKLGWATLSIRQTGIIFAFTLNKVPGGGDMDYTKPGGTTTPPQRTC